MQNCYFCMTGIGIRIIFHIFAKISGYSLSFNTCMLYFTAVLWQRGERCAPLNNAKVDLISPPQNCTQK